MLRSMIRNIKKLFPPKTEMCKKQALQDPGWVNAADACMVLQARHTNKNMHTMH